MHILSFAMNRTRIFISRAALALAQTSYKERTFAQLTEFTAIGHSVAVWGTKSFAE